MSRNNHAGRRGQTVLVVIAAIALCSLFMVVTSSSATATPGNGHSNGHGTSNGQAKSHSQPGNSGHKHGQGNNGSNGHSSGHDNANSNSNHNHGHPGGSGSHSTHGNGGGNGHQGSEGSSNGNGSGGTGDPAGNNGTIKIDGVDFDSHPNNEPHVGCVFQVDFYGFDKGDFNAIVTFADHPPTADGGLTVSSGQGNPSTEFIGEDDASGGGSEAGLDAGETYALAFTGEPHPKQGYHVKLTVNAPGSQGSDVKHKVFWVQDCGDNPQPPAQCPDGSNPGDTNGDGDEDADDCISTPPPPDDQCPDGTNPGDVDGDDDGDTDDCDIIGPPPSSNPLGSLAANCKGIVTVKLDNRKSTVERTYYLERIMAPTATQAWAFKVDGGDVRILIRHGAPGDVFILNTKDKQLGAAMVPATCGSEPPTNPPSGPPSTPQNPLVALYPPTSVDSGLAGSDSAEGAESAPNGIWSLGFSVGAALLLSGGLVLALRRRSRSDVL